MKKRTNRIEDLKHFGEFGGVNPSISDSSTYTFLSAKKMFDTFEGNSEGCYLYSRHSSPSNLYLGEALATLESTEASNVFGSGMAAITAVIMQLCKANDHIISSRTVYGGTYAFLENFATKFNIKSSFVDITNIELVEKSIKKSTKILYCESVSNPLLEVANIKKLSKLAKKYNLKLVVDNTFSPLSISPATLGADIVIHSLTKFINGASDGVGGVVCGSQQFIDDLRNVNNGAAMLFGATLDSLRSASILKNLRTLHVRVKQHSKNAFYLAQKFESMGIKTMYPGLKSNKFNTIFKKQMNPEYGFGGMLTIDVGSLEIANNLMELMQNNNLGYLAVSLGFYKTLFSAPGTSTSSEIEIDKQKKIGLKPGLIRFSIGIDNDIKKTFIEMKNCMKSLNIIK